MSIRAIARLIQTMLYGRRFFHNILGGIEKDGVAAYLPFSCPRFDRHDPLTQVLARCTRSIPLVHTSEKHAVLLVPCRRSFSLS
jgi:hypothetical protein